MTEFDRLLEFQLRRLLDPVVASQIPRRSRLKRKDTPLLSVVAAPREVVAGVLAVIEPAVVVSRRPALLP